MKEFGIQQPGVEYIERVGAYGIVFNGPQVLIEKGRLGYFLPGGGVEEGETIEEALIREFREETGYELLSWKRIGSAIEYREIKKRVDYYFLVELGHKGEPTYDDGHVFPVEWESLTEVQKHIHLPSQWWAIQESKEYLS